jgi:multisubunit Na+/H+ antiporter MnhC subunit
VIGAVVGGVSGFVGGFLGPVVNALVNVVVGAAVGVFGIAVTTRAYQELLTERTEATGVDGEYEEPGGGNDVY